MRPLKYHSRIKILLLTITVLFCISFASMNVAAADCAITIDACCNITSAETYTVTQNLSEEQAGMGVCIDIQASDVVLDCQSYWLNGNSSVNYTNAIWSQNYNNIAIKNCNIKNYTDGIYLQNSNNSNITNNSIKDATGLSIIDHGPAVGSGLGIYLESCNNNNISGNALINDLNYGIYLNFSSNNTFTFNTAEGPNDYGFYINYSSGNNLTNNTSNNGINNIYVDFSSNNNIINNTATGGNGAGIQLMYGSNNRILNNTIYNTGLGIGLSFSSDNNVVAGNNINSSVSGFSVSSSSYNNLTNNIINGSTANGIDVEDSYNNIFTSNIINDSSFNGLFIYSSSAYNNFTNNYIVGNSLFTGISISSAAYNNFTNNTAVSNQYGIRLTSSSSSNSFTNNIAVNNSKYGIYLQSSSNSNNFTNNTASNNTQWDIYITGAPNNLFSSQIVASYPTSINFTYAGSISLKGVTSLPSDPEGYANISKYVNATNQSANSWLYLNVSYNASQVGLARNESTIKIYSNDGSNWYNISGSGVDTVSKYAYANITNFTNNIFSALIDQPQYTVLVMFQIHGEEGYETTIANWDDFYNNYTIDIYDSTVSYTSLSSSVANLMNNTNRNNARDSFDNSYKITWMPITYGPLEFNTNVRNDGIPTNITTYYDALTSNWASDIINYNDSIEWHPHLTSYDDIDNNAHNSWNQVPSTFYPSFNATFQASAEEVLNHYLIDRNFWPSMVTAGWLGETTDYSNWLEQWIPFDASNGAPVVNVPIADPRNNDYNWSIAPSNYSVYHPSSTNYQTSGNMNRTIAETKGPCPLTAASIDKAFNTSIQTQNSSFISCYFHVGDSLTPFTDYVNLTLTRLQNASNYYGIRFKFVDGKEGFQDMLGYIDTTAPNITITRNRNIININSSESLFQPQPYAAVKFANGTYARLNLTVNGSDSWYYNISGITSLFNITVGANDIHGNPGTANISITDMTPPQITAISATNITTNSATINWLTDENADSTVDYGTTTALGSAKNSATLTMSHNITLTAGINAVTLYYYNITSCDVYGTCNTTGPENFTTREAIPPSPGGSPGGGGPTAPTSEAIGGIIAGTSTDVTLGFGSTASFMSNGQQHNIRVSGIFDSTVEITISSNPIKATFKVNDVKQFDTDSNGINDLEITLLSKTDSLVDLRIEVLSEIPTPETTPAIPAGTPPAITPPTTTPTTLLSQGSLKTLALIFIAIFLAYIFLRKHRHKR